MDQILDKLIYALDGDLAPLKARFAEAEALAQKTGAKISSNIGVPLKDMGAAGAAGAGAATKAIKDIDGAVTKTHGSVAVATREFRALFDELSSGRTRMTPGTLAIIATRVFGLSGATLAWGAALAAIPAAFAAAAASADSSLAKIRQQLALTAGASGLTFSGASNVASQIALNANAGIGRAQGIAAGLIGSYVPQSQMQLAGVAEVNASRAGMESDAIQKMLGEMFSDPSKAAEELNQQMHLLTNEQTEEVRRLQDQGDYEKAGQIILQSFSGRVQDAANQAGFLARMLSNAGTNLGNFWHFLARQTGGGAPQEHLQDLETERARVASQGLPGYGFGPATTKALNDLDKQINQQLANMLHGAGKAAAAADTDRARQIGFAAQKVADEYDPQRTKAQKLADQLSLLNKEVDNASGKTKDYYTNLRNSVQTALQHQLNPAQEAALRAQEQERINQAGPKDRARISAEVEAARTLRENLQNPATAQYAQAIYKSQLAGADSDRYAAPKHDREADTRAKNLAAMQQEAAMEEDIAKAYDHGADAAERAKIAGEAHLALIKKQIDKEAAYAEALRKRAFWQQVAANAEKLSELTSGNAGLAGVVAAGGNPALMMQAQIAAEVQKQFFKQLADASTPEEHMRTFQMMGQTANAEMQKAIQSAIIGVQGTIFGQNQTLGNLQARSGVFGADDLRHLQVMQETMDTLVKSGLDPASDDFKKLYNQLLPVNEQISDLTDNFRKIEQAASDFANAVTGPIEQALTGQSKGSFLQAEGQGLLSATVKNFVIEPLNDTLKGMFGNLLSGAMKPDGSSASKALWVQMSPLGAGGIAGGGSSSGGPLGWLMSLFGGGSSLGGMMTPGGFGSFVGGTNLTANGLGGGGILSFLTDILGVVGLAGGGNLDPSQMYVVGERGPEILGPGVSGKITPISAPMSHGGGGTLNYSITATVSGSGDKELMRNMQMIASTTAESAIKQNNAIAKRTQRRSLMAANKRALT